MRALLLALLGPLLGATTQPLPPPAITVPVGYHATATWDAVTTDISGAPIAGVTYKFYSIKNGVRGFVGYTALPVYHWQVNVPQCIEATALVYVNGSPKESATSAPFCIATQ